MTRRRVKLTYRRWRDLDESQKTAAKAQLKSWQNPSKCEFGFSPDGELMSVLDYEPMSNIFSVKT